MSVCLCVCVSVYVVKSVSVYLCVCLFVCLYVCVWSGLFLCISDCLCVSVCVLFWCLSVCLCVCMSVCVCLCVEELYEAVCLCMWSSQFLCTYVSVCLCVSLSVCVCVYVCRRAVWSSMTGSKWLPIKSMIRRLLMMTATSLLLKDFVFLPLLIPLKGSFAVSMLRLRCSLIAATVVTVCASKAEYFYHTSICKGSLGSRNSVRPSVRLSVCLSHVGIVTNLNGALQIFWYRTKGQSLCYSDTNSGWWAFPLPSKICAQSDPPPFEKRRPSSIICYWTRGWPLWLWK